MTDEQLRELAKELPWERPDPARRDAVRSSLLVEASEEGARPARRRWLLAGGGFAAGVLAAAAVAIVVVRDPAIVVAPSSAQIIASAEARLERQVLTTDTGVDEIVLVHDGTVRLAVGESRHGDHVRIRTRDAEIEGAGEYEAVVTAESLSAVSVRSGSAQVTVIGQRTVLLAAGQTWRSSVITTDLSPIPQPRATDLVPDPGPAVRVPDSAPSKAAPAKLARTPDKVPEVQATDLVATGSAAPGLASSTADVAPTPTPTPPTPPTPPTVSDIERRFQAGWALLRAGKAREAAAELQAAADGAPNAPLAGDARYFQAVALVRAGERHEAERVLVAFLDHAPHSLRRGRAAVLLGRLIGDRGDRASARAWLESAVTDPDPAIAAAARAGLAALAPQPTRP